MNSENNSSKRRLETLKKLRDSFTFVKEEETKEVKQNKTIRSVSSGQQYSTSESNSNVNKQFSSRGEYYNLQFEITQIKADILTLFSLILDENIIEVKDKKSLEQAFLAFRTKEFHILNNMIKPLIYGEENNGE